MIEREETVEDLADETRDRILDAAASLIKLHGSDAATTRAVAERAAVQAPTIYRLFGDKRGLLNAVAERELASYVAAKKERAPHSDPVEDLRRGWDSHVKFGVANPGLFLIMSSNADSPATRAGLKILGGLIRAIALVGRLRTSEERAVSMVHSSCTGTILTLLGQDLHTDGLSIATRDAIVNAITTESSDMKNVTRQSAATALGANLDQTSILTAGEKMLLVELLQKLAEN